ncbi:uncharacterized protein LOC123564983 [Mercenaria mercenaria]|uniref:uncharacterized protein LOC123564983 n=1 Tax=Mercenaria mercenaria TaxID=6596 RepID=UPI00234E54C4|nr:uncharacterized protein LOC123564983 [Mercenaria mercenaria]
MAVTGNSPRKSKAKHIDKETNDEAANDTDNDNEDDQEQHHEFIKNKSHATRKENGDTSLDLLEDDIVSAEESVQNFLISTVGKSNSKVYDILSKHGQKLTFRSHDSILKRDESENGLFILLAGKVNVLTSDGSEVMNTLDAGNVFGEISTLFDIPVTAAITAASDVTLVKLSKQITVELFEDFVQDLDIIDWFIQRKYLPTGSDVDSSRVYRRLALKTFKCINLFQTWTEEMIKKLILSFEHNIVILYPKGSIIVLEKDPLTSLYIVISGEIEIKQDSRIIRQIYVTAEKDPFVYTELALMVDGKTSPVTVKASTNCQVIQLNKELVIKILECFPEHMETFSEQARLFRISFQRQGHIYLMNEAYLQIEMLSSYLRQSPFYASSTVQQLWRIILNGDLQEFEEGSGVVLEVECEKYESILVVHGEVLQIHKCDSTEPDSDDDDEAGQSNITHDSDKVVVVLEAGEKDSEQDVSNDKQTFSAGTVIDMETITKMSEPLKANTACLLLKIRKCENVNKTDAHTENKVNTAEKAMSDDALNMV